MIVSIAYQGSNDGSDTDLMSYSGKAAQCVFSLKLKTLGSSPIQLEKRVQGSEDSRVQGWTDKLQATSYKLQAESLKLKAASLKLQVNTNTGMMEFRILELKT